MKLSYEGLKDRAAWEAAGVSLPGYDWREMCAATQLAPAWVHFGAGNIFRGFIAGLQSRLLDQGLVRSGIVAAESFDHEIIDRIYRPFDNMALSVSLLADGSMRRSVTASVARGLKAGAAAPEDMALLREIFCRPSLQMASFTITEKGYALTDARGELLPAVAADLANGPGRCTHLMCLVTALLASRFRAGGDPIAMVSMDNCSRNGERLRRSVICIAEHWKRQGLVSHGFVAWVRDENTVSFPWTMIDKITPRPAKAVEEVLTAAGIEDMGAVTTGKGTFIAPFVNAEAPQYLVVEDNFPNGRPPLERAGVYMTDRDTVNKTEKMKVMTCLNPLHTALAVYGCLLGYDTIANEMRDPLLRTLVERIGYGEGMPVVISPGILDPEDFLREVITQRLPNPFLLDAPQRIATDTSQKVGIRFGETIRSYAARPGLDAAGLTYIPLAIAGWLRYLLGVDDAGRPMACSDDPMLEELQKQLAGTVLGDPDSLGDKLRPILSNQVIWGSDLTALGLGEKIERMVREQLTGPGAVRAALRKYCAAQS